MEERERTFRLACEPADAAIVELLLAEQGFKARHEPFYAMARRAADVPGLPLGSSAAAVFGMLYIQDRSSMLPPLVLNPPPDAWVLDMCASPGSKTGLLAQLVGDAGLVLANEPNRERLANLRRNMGLGNHFCAASCNYPGERLPLEDASWEYILLDPPCSGWGTAEKNPKVLELWRDGKTAPLAALQRALLTEAARLLAPGGRLVYSTCTTNPEENADQARWALDVLELAPAAISSFPGFAAEPDENMLAIAGQAGQNQGFFIAAFTKPGTRNEQRAGGQRGLAGREVDPAALTVAGLDPERLPLGEIRCFTDTAYFLPQPAMEAFPAALRWQGFPLGRMSKDRLRPTPRLRRLLPAFDGGNGVNCTSVQTLQDLLAGRSLQLDAPPGGKGLYYQGLPLGLAQVKDRRVVWSDR